MTCTLAKQLLFKYFPLRIKNVSRAQFERTIYIDKSLNTYIFVILKKGKLKEILSRAIQKAGSLRKLESKTNISKSTLSECYNEKRAIKKENLNKYSPDAE